MGAKVRALMRYSRYPNSSFNIDYGTIDNYNSGQEGSYIVGLETLVRGASTSLLYHLHSNLRTTCTTFYYSNLKIALFLRQR
jgi:hypothetical protein